MLNVSMAQGPMYKALELFKKNQWSVNKMLKQNQLLAKQRADKFENIINEQKSVIMMLQVIKTSLFGKYKVYLQNKLDVVEAKLEETNRKLAEKPEPKGIDDLATKVSTIEIRLQKLCKKNAFQISFFDFDHDYLFVPSS